MAVTAATVASTLPAVGCCSWRRAAITPVTTNGSASDQENRPYCSGRNILAASQTPRATARLAHQGDRVSLAKREFWEIVKRTGCFRKRRDKDPPDSSGRRSAIASCCWLRAKGAQLGSMSEQRSGGQLGDCGMVVSRKPPRSALECARYLIPRSYGYLFRSCSRFLPIVQLADDAPRIAAKDQWAGRARPVLSVPSAVVRPL